MNDNITILNMLNALLTQYPHIALNRIFENGEPFVIVIFDPETMLVLAEGKTLEACFNDLLQRQNRNATDSRLNPSPNPTTLA